MAVVCGLELQFNCCLFVVCFYNSKHKQYIMMFVPHLDPRHLLHTHKHKIIHYLTSLCSTSAVCERAVCHDISPVGCLFWVIRPLLCVSLGSFGGPIWQA